jgi:rhamnulokinase
MIKYYLAIDLGASGGRHILGSVQNGRLVLEELYIFANQPKSEGGRLVWDIDGIFREILNGLKEAKRVGKIPSKIGVDTWGVDYVLLDKSDREIYPCYCYRDSGTEPFLNAPVSYERTGIQKQPFNTVYRLLADKADGRLGGAASMLMLPEYFSFKLTGVKAREYTNATTGALVNALTKDWDFQTIESLDLPKKLFPPLVFPGHVLGGFTAKMQAEIGYSAQVVFPATHDTASAVAAVPRENSLFISSGTWSLLGIESEPVLSAEAEKRGYTNEGALDGKIRLLKNIMGLWIIQQIRREAGGDISFAQMAKEAESGAVFDWKIDINHKSFFAPDSMTDAVKSRCAAEGQPVPEGIGQLSHCVYNSLAHSYKNAIDELEALLKRRFDSVCIVGGGSNNDYLNGLTARIAKRVVYAGPGEATAAGNIIVLMRSDGVFDSYASAKRLITDSFGIKTIKP